MSRFHSGEAMIKISSGRKYLWVEDPECPLGASPGADSRGVSVSPSVQSGLPGEDAGPEEGVTGEEESLVHQGQVSKIPLTQELALQTERAIALVERSLGAFMMMHQEVVQEKDRAVVRAMEKAGGRDHELDELENKIGELENIIKDKEQEIADMRMLVSILEKRLGRKAPEPAPLDGAESVRTSESAWHSERASVGDLMEDQLRYIMEEEMIKDLLKE